MENASYYYFFSNCKAVSLCFFLLTFCFGVPTVKQNFGLIERIVMGCWFSVSCIVCSVRLALCPHQPWC